MWLGKLAVILYIFSIGVTFMGYYLDSTLNTGLFSGATFEALDDLATRNEVNTTPNIDLIFGDFLAGATVLFGILTAENLAQVFGMLPSFTEPWYILVRILFTLSTAFLWINIITGRDL